MGGSHKPLNYKCFLASKSLSIVVAAGLLIMTGFAAAWLGAAGATHYVDDANCPAAGSGTLTDPYCLIQDAICASTAGDLVSVAPGTYQESIRMRPGVSVVSQAGAAVTTINASGQPCTETDYCTKRTGNQCSVVLFGSGHTTATRIEGFTITGGAGTIQTSLVAGGGIFVFSSATILNNVITNNILSGPRDDLYGAGVYVAVGRPVISNNTISGNRAVPPAGASGAPTFGYGGGLWLGFSSDAIVTGNVITGNHAGDTALAYSLGAGGGLVIWPGESTRPGVLVDRNLIADNIADSNGGGVALLSRPNTGSLAVVSNNVIVGNGSKYGGGVYTYFNKSSTINNTITDNEGFLGAGVYSGQGDVTLPVTISNNIIEGNRLRQFGTGGGIYTLDLSATFSPVISFNDLWNNDRNQCAGEQSDATCIGSSGNFSGDPLFMNRAARDFNIDANSPAVDTASDPLAPPVDHDNDPRGVDGDGTPDSPQAGDVDVGAFELSSCTASAEVCDGFDNDCNNQVDDGLGSTTCGVGVCEVSVQNCAGGVPQTCTPGTPGAEVCNSLDDDCNGQPDDGLGSTTCGVGQCERTVQNCLGGAPQSCVPGAPATEMCDGLDNNCDGATDEALGSSTCGLGACEVTVDNCVGGMTQSCVPGSPSAEVCGDAIDNDCNGVADDGFPDSDSDSMLDCVDPDDDNDTVEDALDCAPLDAGSWAPPVEVGGLDVLTAAPATIVYELQSAGPSTHYEIVSGLLGRLAATQSFSDGFCVSSSTSGGTWFDSRPAPPAGDGWYYLMRSANGCGLGTFGSSMRDAAGSGDACQIGRVDSDGDGAPADLDCDDTNAVNSPFAPEVCDGVDNNCDQVADEGNPGGGQSCGTNFGECQAGTTVCSGGSLSCDGAVGPSEEICDGLDNDCDSIIDNSTADFDLDGTSDCLDPDDDNDLVDDAADCAPMDASAFGLPMEVTDLLVTDSGQTEISWTEQSIGSGTLYDVASGQIAEAGLIDFPSGNCLGSGTASPAIDSRALPPPDTAWYYLVRSRNSCGHGTYGSAERDTHPACP